MLTTPVNATVIRSAVDEANNAAFRGHGSDAQLAIHISTSPFPDVGLPPGVESVVGVSSGADLHKLLVVEVLKMGVGVGAGDYASKLEVRREVISGEKVAEGIHGVMGGKQEAEAVRKKAMELRAKARSATEKGGTSYDDVEKLIHDLMACRRRSVH